MIKAYIYSKCSTCHKALAWLDEQGIEYEVHPIRETPPSLKELKFALDQLDGQLRKLFNTSGMDYRAMGMKDRLPDMSDPEALELLSHNGNLIKRPLLLGTDFALAGFKPDPWQKTLNERGH